MKPEVGALGESTASTTDLRWWRREYAKSVQNTKRLNGVKPDAGLLFDLLMAPDDEKFKEKPAGISSMLFYHAAIIIHDIFRTNRTEMKKSGASSYLDLASLYGEGVPHGVGNQALLRLEHSIPKDPSVHIKPALNAGSSICPTYTVGRAVLSDAVIIIRSDRFNTIDFTIYNLTSWGYNEIQQDYMTMVGSMLYKLIQRGLPGWFPFNSITVMQPMYTKQANEKTAKELGTFDQFTTDDPTPPRKLVVLKSSAAIKQVSENTKQFPVPWLPAMNSIFPGKKDYNWYMLSGTDAKNHENRVSITKALSKATNLHEAIHDCIECVGKQLIEKEFFKLKEERHQLYIIRDIAIPLNAQMLTDLFYLGLRTDENPEGTLGTAELYKHLLNTRICKLVTEVKLGRGLGLGVILALSNTVTRKAYIKKGSPRAVGLLLVGELLNQGNPVYRVVDTLWLTVFGGVGVPVTAFYEVLAFFLNPENISIWSRLSPKRVKMQLSMYMLQKGSVSRLLSMPCVLRRKQLSMKARRSSQRQDKIQRRSKTLNKFDPYRNTEYVPAFGYGMHECFGREIALAFVAGLVKLAADVKQLRPAPGQKTI
ncbi:hypothetical protein BKA67DRAFT_655098 [Truncatella angustata]|uniref:Uncharacterized protein n=1 Tax=Truncatella angustata TaxID=152316 RepID=A0A9P8UR20_9PEZI|nr:uncharacterized protein BKA67DRAFT_655098 [Truncatella angustata]KAH6656789.1 hypothetical protein BKA67DRAFT_655098 [Truncatella angustata]